MTFLLTQNTNPEEALLELVGALSTQHTLCISLQLVRFLQRYTTSLLALKTKQTLICVYFSSGCVVLVVAKLTTLMTRTWLRYCTFLPLLNNPTVGISSACCLALADEIWYFFTFSSSHFFSAAIHHILVTSEEAAVPTTRTCTRASFHYPIPRKRLIFSLKCNEMETGQLV